jgi:hypothetical protein
MMDVNTTRTHNDAMQAACKIMNLPQNNKYAINELLMSHWSGNVFLCTQTDNMKVDTYIPI